MFSEKTFEKLFQTMNGHVPIQRPSLERLLEMEDPTYCGKDGRTYHVDKSELVLLSGYVDKWDWPKLKIPILLMTDTNYENGMWKVIGRSEVKVMSSFLKREPEKEDEMLIFYPQLLEIRKKFPTAVNAMFMP